MPAHIAMQAIIAMMALIFLFFVIWFSFQGMVALRAVDSATKKKIRARTPNGTYEQNLLTH